MKKYLKNILVALVCFLIIIIINFILPRLLPGDPIAYLSGFSEEDMSTTQYEYYYKALHLDKNLFVQFFYYIKSLFDGTLGYSFKKEATVSSLISSRLSATLQITLPAVFISTIIGLIWGLYEGFKKDSKSDKISTTILIAINTIPTFVIALVFIAFFAFKLKWFPYAGLNGRDVETGTINYFIDRLYHLILPIFTLLIATIPSRYLLMRNTARKIADEKYILYAKERGLSDYKIQYQYMLKNIIQPFITMVGMSVSICVGGSVIIENIFSINGMGKLLIESVHSLDYPLMQGILFVTTLLMVISIIITDIICIIIDPKEKGDESYEK